MVEVNGISKHFGGFVAVDEVTLSVSNGEVLALLGPNGAGKTTLIRMLCGLLGLSSGKATIMGYDVVRQASDVRRVLGYMSQRFSLYDDLTVGENLQFFGSVYGLTGSRLKTRVDEIADRLDFAKFINVLAGQLSAGTRQRVAFATATLHRPGVLFLDEPTSGVDPMARQAFWDMVYLFAADGATAVLSTHYMEEAEQADKVAMMIKGRLVSYGTPRELKGSEYTNLEEVFFHGQPRQD